MKNYKYEFYTDKNTMIYSMCSTEEPKSMIERFLSREWVSLGEKDSPETITINTHKLLCIISREVE